MTNLLEVYEEWQNNAEFREAFKKNPIAALDAWGYKLNPEDLEKILKFKEDNEPLDDRISK